MERITKQDIEPFGATVGCNQRHQKGASPFTSLHEECLRINPHGAGILDRRSEVINETWAEEVQRSEQRKGRLSRVANSSTKTKMSSINVTRIKRESNWTRSESQEKVTHEDSVVNSQRQQRSGRREIVQVNHDRLRKTQS